ncbi:MAG TPA: SAM-dependent methyltransferase [Chloroflexi bacterium]|nr:SAM-dependent methyltransferase [Chloroflexota bacterium]
MSDTPGDAAALKAESREIWNRNAAFWDDYMGAEGNDFHRLLVSPSAERLLEVRAGEKVLEIACGAGLFARRVADLGGRVLATDFSETFIERAKQRSKRYAGRIEFRVVDATEAGELISLGEKRFDAAVSNMALMDMAQIEPLASSLPRLLKPNGRFVFTITHPCFNSAGANLLAEQEVVDGEVLVNHSVRVKQYLGLSRSKGVGIVGQPALQYYFDRPLHQLLAPFFASGLRMDGIEEPSFDRSVTSSREMSWSGQFHEIPPVLAVRLRSPE